MLFLKREICIVKEVNEIRIMQRGHNDKDRLHI
jgi:hypothetical protein